MDYLNNFNSLVLQAVQQIDLDNKPPHFIEIREKEFFLKFWEGLKFILQPELNIIERLKGLISIIINIINYPLFVLDSQPIALSNIILGIILLMLGLKYARMLSNKATLKLTKLTKIEKTSEEAIKKIIYYFLMATLTIVILDVSHVPLTIFTVIGGALAIGLGLGTQNLSNDFISGILIMIEQPFKIGDIIQIGSLIGQVQQIGARCTMLRNGENKDTMVPNSTLLKNNITNWSSNGNYIKKTTVIPVEHNSSIIKVTEILEKALANQPDIANNLYRPQAFLTSFNEKALNFEMSFMYNLQSVDDKEILHQVHSRILHDFEANGIHIARGKKVIIQDETADKDSDEGE